MWPGDPWLYHAHLAAALNLKLLNPREVVAAAVAACEAGHAPLASVEGFVRRSSAGANTCAASTGRRCPATWSATRSAPARTCRTGTGPAPPTWPACATRIGQTLAHGYANHIQRLMVTGLYALMLGVQPRQVHAWYLAVYVDAVEWVELPNTLGMSQYADGGVMGSKPYVATGKYIERMSPHCKGCRYDPAQRTGDRACPFTTLYWDFLMRHEAKLAKNPRMALQVRNLARMNATQRQDVAARAAAIRRGEVGAMREQLLARLHVRDARSTGLSRGPGATHPSKAYVMSSIALVTRRQRRHRPRPGPPVARPRLPRCGGGARCEPPRRRRRRGAHRSRHHHARGCHARRRGLPGSARRGAHAAGPLRRQHADRALAPHARRRLPRGDACQPGQRGVHPAGLDRRAAGRARGCGVRQFRGGAHRRCQPRGDRRGQGRRRGPGTRRGRHLRGAGPARECRGAWLDRNAHDGGHAER